MLLLQRVRVIEWIQKCKKYYCRSIIRYYYDILNATDPAEVVKALVDSQQKTELLTLYFGPEDCACDAILAIEIICQMKMTIQEKTT